MWNRKPDWESRSYKFLNPVVQWNAALIPTHGSNEDDRQHL